MKHQDRQMSKLGFGICSIEPSIHAFFAAQWTCPKHTEAEAKTVAARRKYLAKR